MGIGSSPTTSATPRFATTWRHLESTNPAINPPTIWAGSYSADTSTPLDNVQPRGTQGHLPPAQQGADRDCRSAITRHAHRFEGGGASAHRHAEGEPVRDRGSR